ncbi:MAG: hypothetical protein F4Y67_05280 [Chloroflexi bacterium]|nr:hypothetical protein [Chloroflexota bacterium]MYB16666.1 hypothetical protein [Chloroflexota bacterium]
MTFPLGRQYPLRIAILPRPAAARLLVALLAVAAVIAVSPAFDAALGQDEQRCAATALGQLSDPTAALEASGRWSTADCESELRPGSEARHFEFEVAAAGRVRIELTSESADPYLYLFDSDGNRLADDDDGGQLLNARIERELEPGTYQIEATTVGGRARGAASFALTIGFVEGCEIIPLGTLQPGTDLAASGTWSHQTCGSRIVVAHPARNYLFQIPEPGRVRVDLTSTNGDPVLSMATPEGAVIGANDDGGIGNNARIEKFLPAGAYIVEATTYSRGGLQPLAADFELFIRLIDELDRQLMPAPKVEALVVPDRVIAGEPFTVHYRVGNVGGGDLHEVAPIVQVQGYGPGSTGGFIRQWFYNLAVTESAWSAGSSYHTGDVTASGSSETLAGVAAQEMTLNRPGRSWVLVALFVLDEERRGVSYHSVWKHIDVIDGATFGPLRVRVDDSTFEVTAQSDADGEVTRTVTDLADREAAVGILQRRQAVFAAGVRSVLLGGIFDRPAVSRLEELRTGTVPVPGDPDFPTGPTPDSVRAALARDYLMSVTESGLAGSHSAGLLIDPARVEGLVLVSAQNASRKYAALASSWRNLQSRLAGGAAISYAEALALLSQLRYAESVLAPLIDAGELVRSARTDDEGWDGAVAEQLSEFAREATCFGSVRGLAGMLALADGADPAAALDLDAELRLALPLFGYLVDNAQCAIAEIDDENDQLLSTLGISPFQALQLPGYRFVSTAPADEPDPHRLRILVRVHEDGRVEHAVELANGRRILPQRRFLEADSQPGAQHSSSAVQLFGQSIGVIRSIRDAEGRILLSFLASDGAHIEPRARILPADASVGVWLRTSQIEVPPATPTLAAIG